MHDLGTARNVLHAHPTNWGQQLLESDCRYFEAGAIKKTEMGADIVYMPGLESLAAGCVIQRLQPAQITCSWHDWLTHLENQLSALGISACRLYLSQTPAALATVLQHHGYQAQVETALMSDPLEPRPRPDLILSPVETAHHWRQKLKIHQASIDGPDGHSNRPEDWLAMEQQKCQAGVMNSYLICDQGHICGTVSTMDMGQWLRLKNLVIHPQWRRQGIGKRTVEALKHLAWSSGKQRLGCFALAGGAGERVYQRAHLTILTQQTEWYKPLITLQNLSGPRPEALYE